MIEQLLVKDYILFEQAEIQFNHSMSVITGETGAGKSLLIDAIGYLSGNRITSDIVRKGKEKAILQMVLSCESEQIQSFLKENEYPVEDTILIQRIVTKDRKSTIRVNQQLSTLSFVKTLVSMVVDVHSQMDTYQLMDKKVQLQLLDAYCANFSLLEQVKEAYLAYKEVKDHYDTLVNETYSDDELDFLTHQYNQIEQADIQKGELEQLQENIKEISQADQNIDLISQSVKMIHSESGISDQLYSCFKSLEKMGSFDSLSNELRDMYYRIDEIKEILQEKLDFYQSETKDLDSMQAREFEIRSLFKRFGGNYEALMAKKEKLLEQIDQIIHKEDVLKRLEAQIQEKEKQYILLANKLSEKRLNAFSELSKEVSNQCQDLMLEHARFEIQRKEKTYSLDGIDDIEFMVSMNPGSALTFLKESASGGELSRLMLALKVVFQSQQGIQTIIFDEIDTGVSGKVAFAMGQKMKNLSRNYQVLCITHLASVAAAADYHYYVTKVAQKEMTTTSVKELNQQDMIGELATMSTGTTNQADIEAAKELKKRAHHG